jgi:ABC-type polysaccharide/polyol phosphate export permease
LILYLISYVVLFGACLAYGYFPSAGWLLLPVVIAVHSLLIVTLMFVVSVLSLHFADFQRFLPFALRLWFFISPALYDTDAIKNLPAPVQMILNANPMTVVLHSYRDCLFHGTITDPAGLGILAAILAPALLLSTLLFLREEPYISRHV